MSAFIERDYEYLSAMPEAALTNGCFDILTVAHVRLLKKARLFGKQLIVAVNSDESVRRLKGDGRPVNKLEDRMEVLSELEGVYGVISFDGDDISEVLLALQPNAWIKGGDYTMEKLNKDEVSSARDVGTAIVILEKFGDYSTTEIIRRLKNRA